MSPENQALLMAIRQALIMILGAIEDRLGLERSIIPRRKRMDRNEIGRLG